MRIFKGLENIHAVIDRHEIEWRREQGEQVDDLPEFSIEESVRRRFTKSTAEGSGRFSPDRFLGDTKKEKKSNVEVIDVIKQKDDKPHSWLYNEVLKAIQDAAAIDKKTKVIAVFIPVIQNGKEFEDLPVDASVTLPPASEEEINFTVENLTDNNTSGTDEKANDSTTEQEPSASTEDFNLIPEGQEHPDEELAEAFSVMEEKLDEALNNNQDPETEAPAEENILPEVEEVHEEILEPMPEPEAETQEDLNLPGGFEPEAENEDTESNFPEVRAAEVLNFEEFPVITGEPEAAADDIIEEITPDTQEEVEEEDEKEEQPEIAPLDDLEDDEVFEDPERLTEFHDDPDNATDDDEEIIKLG